MPRIRTIKPEFWTSEQVMELSRDARLLFIGMWNFCDDNGVHPASAKALKAKILPGDDITVNDVAGLIKELLAQGLINEFSVENQKWWHVTGWSHQLINRPTKSRYPKPPCIAPLPSAAGMDDAHCLADANPVTNTPIWLASSVPTSETPIIAPSYDNNVALSEDSVRTHGVLSEDSVRTHGVLTESPRIGKEGIGKESRVKDRKGREKVPAHTSEPLDLSILPKDLSSTVWNDFTSHMRSKNKPIATQTELQHIVAELEIASNLGITPDAALSEVIVAGWKSFRANWLIERLANVRKPEKPNNRRNTNNANAANANAALLADYEAIPGEIVAGNEYAEIRRLAS